MKLRRFKLTLLALGGMAALAVAPARANRGADEMFQKMDTNGDGKISAEEHTAGAKKMFETMDANGDGKVTAAEMTAAHDKITGSRGQDQAGSKAYTKNDKPEMSAEDKIKAVDTNGDGVLTAEEHAAGARAIYEKMDTNRDGLLTKAEMAAGHAKLLHKGAK